MTTEKPTNNPLYQKVADVIERIRPSIQLDGGDIELVSVNDKGVVSIRFLGACIGCPSLNMTLQSGIEATLKELVQEVTHVEAIE